MRIVFLYFALGLLMLSLPSWLLGAYAALRFTEIL